MSARWQLVLGAWLALAPAAAAAAAAAPAAADSGLPEADGAEPAGGEDPAVAARQARRFAEAMGRYHRKDAKGAARLLHQFLAEAHPLTENLGWAQHFMGESLIQLKLTYAGAIYHWLVAKTRSQPEVIAESLGRLMQLSETAAFDHELVVEELLYDGDFGILSGDLEGWVAFERGRQDLALGAVEWAERHFKRIDPHSRWAAEAAYAMGVQQTREHQDLDAEAAFERARDNPAAALEVKKNSTLGLARLAFEREAHGRALELYDQVPQVRLSYEEAVVLTEKAWVHYHAGEHAQALGLLHALASPAYAPYFFPETYLLRALIYKDLCHHLAAKHAVRAFRGRYGRIIEQLKARVPVEQIEPIRRAALTAGVIAPRTYLLRALRSERAAVGRLGDRHQSGLAAEVDALYAQALARHGRLWQVRFDDTADRVAESLLETQEQMGLIDLEVSLAIYRPLGERVLVPVEQAEAERPEAGFYDAYLFDGEYWNPELNRYRVFIKNQCFVEAQP